MRRPYLLRMNNPEKPMRNRKGQFVKGHPKSSTSNRFPHATDPRRTANGEYSYGNQANLGGQNAATLAQIRKRFLQCVTVAEIEQVHLELLKLTQTEHNPDPKERRQAIDTYLKWTTGMPSQHVNITGQVQQTQLNYNLHHLSDAELKQLETILSKTQPGAKAPKALPAKTDPEIVIEG